MNCLNIKGSFTGGTCKNTMGGIKTYWIGAYNETVVTTLDAEDQVAESVIDSVGDVKFWKFTLPVDIGDAVEDVNADPKLGTSFVAQTLNATLLGLAKEYSKELSDMMKGKQILIAELYDGAYVLYGAFNALDLTGGGSRTGTEAASLQGYELTWTGTERNYAPFVEAPTLGNDPTGGDFITV